jgi:hypothetical protein
MSLDEIGVVRIHADGYTEQTSGIVLIVQYSTCENKVEAVNQISQSHHIQLNCGAMGTTTCSFFLTKPAVLGTVCSLPDA